MRLSLVNFFGKRPHGFKYRGKNRVVKPIKFDELQKLKLDYERTEENMLYLRYPYLTIEQSHAHMVHKKEEKRLKAIENSMKLRDEKFSKHVTLAERLIHLKVKEAWE